jgi:protocatechuate 3,4-dioxygenase alpha subunit
MKPVTPSQTIGPFWHPLAEPALADLTRFGAAGDKLTLTGTIVDGDGAPVTDACVELWQATPAASPTFPGWGRCATGARGEYALTTVMPDPAAPYAAIAVLARGLIKPLWTRVYFVDTNDAVLASLAPARRATLLARADAGAWRWDIRLQGEPETVFFDL